MRLFLSVRSQWRTANGRPVGLDYVAVQAAAAMAATPIEPATFHGLQVMELAVLEYLAHD